MESEIRVKMIKNTLIGIALLLALTACGDGSNTAIVNPDVFISQPPGTVPDDPFPINSLVNGINNNSYETAWVCRDVGYTEPNAFYAMGFFANATGFYAARGEIVNIGWTSTANNIDMTFPGDARNLRFANIVFTSIGIFTANFEITNEETSEIFCELNDLQMNPIY